MQAKYTGKVGHIEWPEIIDGGSLNSGYNFMVGFKKSALVARPVPA